MKHCSDKKEEYCRAEETVPAGKSGKGKWILLLPVGLLAAVGAVLAVLLTWGHTQGSQEAVQTTQNTNTSVSLTETTQPDPSLYAVGSYYGVSIADIAVTAADAWIELKEDGKCALFMIDETISADWVLEGERLLLSHNAETLEGTLRDQELTLYLEGMEIRFQKGEKSPGEGDSVLAEVDSHWWEGDWYGWWTVTQGRGYYAQWTEWCWDCCATVTLTADAEAAITLWDSDSSFESPLAKAELILRPGQSDKGSMVSLGGMFMEDRIDFLQWKIDPETGVAAAYDQMICIEGTYQDPSSPEDGFDYLFVLRPWGVTWEDVQTAEGIYEDMMPVFYTQWYLPLLEKGVQELPHSYEEGFAIIGQ